MKKVGKKSGEQPGRSGGVRKNPESDKKSPQVFFHHNTYIHSCFIDNASHISHQHGHGNFVWHLACIFDYFHISGRTQQMPKMRQLLSYARIDPPDSAQMPPLSTSHIHRQTQVSTIRNRLLTRQSKPHLYKPGILHSTFFIQDATYTHSSIAVISLLQISSSFSEAVIF